MVFLRRAAEAAEERSMLRAERLRLTGCPPGHRPLSYDERTATLESLRCPVLLSEAEIDEARG